MSAFLPRSRSRPPTPACPPRLSFHRPQRPWRPPRLPHTTAGPLGPVTSGLSEAPAMCPLARAPPAEGRWQQAQRVCGGGYACGCLTDVTTSRAHTRKSSLGAPESWSRAGKVRGGGAGGSKTSGWGRGRRPEVPKVAARWLRRVAAARGRAPCSIYGESLPGPRATGPAASAPPRPGHALATRMPAMTHPSAAHAHSRDWTSCP